MERCIELEVIVDARVEEVWRAWTTTEGVKGFFAPDANIELRVGGPFEIFFDPSKPPGDRGADGMEIIGFQPNRMLSFTWNAPWEFPEARKQRTVVIIRLEPLPVERTRVTLRHLAWGVGGEWDQTFYYFSQAWPRVLENLQRRFSEGPINQSAT